MEMNLSLEYGAIISNLDIGNLMHEVELQIVDYGRAVPILTHEGERKPSADNFYVKLVDAIEINNNEVLFNRSSAWLIPIMINELAEINIRHNDCYWAIDFPDNN